MTDGEVSQTNRVPRWAIKAIALFWVGYVVVFLGTGLIRDLRSLITVFVISLFISFAIEPAVNRLNRYGIRRGLGVWIVYIAFFAGLGLFSASLGNALATQLNSFVDEAPAIIDNLEGWLQRNIDDTIDLQSLSDEFVEGGGASDLVNRFADDAVNLGATVLSGLFNTVTVLLFTFYLVAEGPQIRRAVCSYFPPARQEMVLSIWDLAIEKTGGYIASRGVLALFSFLAHWLAFELLSVPFSLPLALFVGIVSQFIPVIGTYIAGALPVVIALLESPRLGLAVLIVVIVYQQIENYLFAPKVTAQTMEIHVAVAFGAVIAGAAVMGVVGALLALPLTATAQAFVSGYRQHFDVEESALLASARRRGRKT